MHQVSHAFSSSLTRRLLFYFSTTFFFCCLQQCLLVALIAVQIGDDSNQIHSQPQQALEFERSEVHRGCFVLLAQQNETC